MLRWSVLLVAAIFAGCTEQNPRSCLTTANVCGASEICIEGRDNQGRVWSVCLAVDGGEPPIETGQDGSASDTSEPDAAVSSRDVPPPPDTVAVTPDAKPTSADLIQDVGPPLVDACMSECTLGSSRCGSTGGVRKCIPDGACTKLGPETSCGQSVCVDNACKPICVSSSDCSIGTFCDTPNCISQCGAHDSANVIPNAGFDRAVDGFGPGTWQQVDAASCSTSGSLYVYPTSRSEAFAIASGSNYFFGFWAKNFGITADTSCDLEWCPSMFCSGVSIISVDTLAVPGTLGWQKLVKQVVAPVNAKAARITCRSGGVNLDRFFLSTAGPKF